MVEKNQHHEKRLFPAFLWIVPILLLSVSALLTVRSVRKADEEITEKQLGIVHQVRNNLDYRMVQHEEIANGIMLSITNLLNSSADPAGQYSEYTDITNVLISNADRGMIGGIRLYAPDAKIYSNQRDIFYPLSDLIQSEYQDSLNPGFHWLPTHPAKISFRQMTPSIALMYNLSQLDNHNILASSLLLYIPVSHINELLNAGTADEAFFLTDVTGKILASQDGEKIGTSLFSVQQLDQILDSGTGYFTDTGYTTTFSKLSKTDWYVIARVPRGRIPVLDSSRLILLLALWLVTILSVVCILFSWSYHRMRTIRQQYNDQIEIADYQMQSLQEQIKPHFLYNTLDIIKWMIVENHHEDAIWMVNALSKYLRMSINRTSGVTTLRQELELGRIYLDIIQKRFRDRFAVITEVDEDTMECLLPRLLLQPIMENAVIHGLLCCEKSNATLTVRAWREGKMLSIEIEDNGIGIPANKLDELEQTSDTGGYGLRNIRKRIQLFGGQDACMQIHSREGIGTCVTICVPVMMEQNSPSEA